MYKVRWKRIALDRITELWLDATDRAEITASVGEIDRMLASNPQDAGESRCESIRVLFVAPLGVFFEVDDSTRTVHVLKAWSF